MNRKTYAVTPTVLLLLLAAISNVSCAAKRVDPTTGVSTSATPYENVLAINASVAVVNNSLAKGTIQLQEAGVISLNTARNILNVTYRIASLDTNLTNILRAGPDAAKAESAAIRTITRDMIGLLADIMLLIDREKAAQVSTDTIALAKLINGLVEALRDAGVLQ